MTTTLAHFVQPGPDQDQVTADLLAAVPATFLDLMGWQHEVKLLHFPLGEPLLSAAECQVKGCEKRVRAPEDRGLCAGCWKRMEAGGLSREEFLATTVRHWRGIGISNCRVADCARPWKTALEPLCTTHSYQRKRVLRMSLEEFLLHPEVVPLPGFGACQVVACTRERPGHAPYCLAHAQRWNREKRLGTADDEEMWRRTTGAIAEAGVVSLRGLPDRVVAELLFGLHQRFAAGIKQRDENLRPLCDQLRVLQLPSLEDVDADALGASTGRMFREMLKHLRVSQLSPETERFKSVWDTRAFGFRGFLTFEDISQEWLRRAVQDWALDDLPKRRGSQARNAVQLQVRSVGRLSESLRLNRADAGADPRLLGRDDIVLFLNRMRLLVDKGEVSGYRHVLDVRDAKRLLGRMRSLGLTQPGQPLHGLSRDFALRPGDVPDDPDDAEAGRDLPTEVMRFLSDRLDAFTSDFDQHIRAATEILMDTGRRPAEVSNLPWDCLERDGDGKLVLVYDNRKALRNARRLPIADTTADVIRRQQERTRSLFPDTPQRALKLFPAWRTNPDGTKALDHERITERHRSWVDSLPDVFVPITIERDGKRVTEMLPFDKAKIFPYAYRHTYAQRHADANIRIDVLKELMDHRQLDTTQRYYRVSETRKREAVDRVTAMQFDRHGTRVWRTAQTLLDSEHVRRAIGETQVPYGVCTEPTNVVAGGMDCPVRFRCVGCDHFRTDASYLPDLEAYLADLLRNRERLAAFVHADDWARSEAMPSDDEIKKVRRLVQRVKEDLDALSDEDRAHIREATAVLRRSRTVVSLGMPRIGPPISDFSGSSGRLA
ncbi:site-specific integrase [Streptomyces orinoci]|uniref:Site-specific integrase n=1 Tax=Streptomyces orinoci TaxID=67339 RepID=A0ABV3K845_STRON|nr:site-specific integrase [Streptomyces orinoci]